MTRKNKSKEIRELFSQGKSSRDIMNLGYKPGTVYGVQRELRSENHSTGRRMPGASGVGADKTGQALESRPDAEIESDPEIVQLKKEIRKTGLERELARLRGRPLEMEAIVAAARYIGSVKRDSCPRIRDGLCTYYGGDTGEDILKGTEELVGEDGLWCIKPSPVFCAMCRATEEEVVDHLLERMGEGSRK